MPALDIGSFLTPGVVYTFSFSPDAASILDSTFKSDLSSLIAPLQYVSRITGATVAHGSSLLSFQLDVTFTYIGDGSDTVANAVQWILEAWTTSQLFGNYSYVGANGGASPIVTNAGGGEILPAVQSVIPSTSSLWPLAIIVLLIVFVVSGGAGVTRTLAKRVT